MKNRLLILLLVAVFSLLGFAVYADSYDEGYTDGYNDGVIYGQQSADIAESAIEGFFNGITGFVNTFLDIGVGAVTLRNVVAVLSVGLFVAFILKMRG